MMKPKRRVYSDDKPKRKLMKKKKSESVNPLAPRPLRIVSRLKTGKKSKKRPIKKRTYPMRYKPQKSHKKIPFRRQFSLPGKSSPVVVSSSDLLRGVKIAFKGKSYKLTLRQMIKVLRRRNLLKSRKTKQKPKRLTGHHKYLRKKVTPKKSAPQSKSYKRQKP